MNYRKGIRPRRVFSLFLVTRAHWFFPTLEKKNTREKNTKCNVLRSRAFEIEHNSSRTGWFSFFLCLLVACRNCTCAGPLPCRRWYEDRDLPRKVGKWKKKLHILLGKLALDWCNIDREVPNNATLAWWLIMGTSRKRCRRRVELAGEAVTAAESVFFFFEVLCFFISLPHWFFSSM